MGYKELKEERGFQLLYIVSTYSKLYLQFDNEERKFTLRHIFIKYQLDR
jgi:hypothetical protein